MVLGEAAQAAHIQTGNVIFRALERLWLMARVPFLIVVYPELFDHEE